MWMFGLSDWVRTQKNKIIQFKQERRVTATAIWRCYILIFISLVHVQIDFSLFKRFIFGHFCLYCGEDCGIKAGDMGESKRTTRSKQSLAQF